MRQAQTEFHTRRVLNFRVGSWNGRRQAKGESCVNAARLIAHTVSGFYQDLQAHHSGAILDLVLAWLGWASAKNWHKQKDTER